MAAKHGGTDEDAAQLPGIAVEAEDEGDLRDDSRSSAGRRAHDIGLDDPELAGGQVAERDGDGHGAVGIGAEELGVGGGGVRGRVEQVHGVDLRLAALHGWAAGFDGLADRVPLRGDGGQQGGLHGGGILLHDGDVQTLGGTGKGIAVGAAHLGLGGTTGGVAGYRSGNEAADQTA